MTTPNDAPVPLPSSKLRGRWSLTVNDHGRIAEKLRVMHVDLMMVGNVAGSAYGARLADMAIRADRKLFRLRIGLLDLFNDENPAGTANPYAKAFSEWAEPARNHRADLRCAAAVVIEPHLEYIEPPLIRKRAEPLLFRVHLVVGDTLMAANEILLDLRGQDLVPAYGKTHGTVTRATAAIRSLQTLRSALDDKVCSEYSPNVNCVEGIQIVRVYYGWQEAAKDKRRDADPKNGKRRA